MAEFHRLDLLHAKEHTPMLEARILTRNDDLVCDECRELSKKIFTIDEALKTMPIPHKCTNENCRCTWGFQIPDDF